MTILRYVFDEVCVYLMRHERHEQQLSRSRSVLFVEAGTIT